MNLPERDDTQPYLGWKYARLIWIPGDHFLFSGMNAGQGTQFGLRARAECLTQRTHEDPNMPASDCMCGFYAMAQADKDWPTLFTADRVQCEVELGGRVIVARLGFRAEWQRILSVAVPRICFGCGQPATCVAVVDEGTPYHAVSWCDEHAEGKRRLPIEHIAADLGIGVTWADAHVPPSRAQEFPEHLRP